MRIAWQDVLSYFAVWFVWLYGAIEVPRLVMLPRLAEFSVLSLGWYAFVLVMTMACFLLASRTDPGYIVSDADLQSYIARFLIRDRPSMEFCPKCNRERPSRAHHCSKCGRCVLEMDHHCPFVLNCVGEHNRWRFILLLFYGVLLCLAAQYHLWRDTLGYYSPTCTAASISASTSLLADSLFKSLTPLTVSCPSHRSLRLGSAILVSFITLVGMSMLLAVQCIGIRESRTTLELLEIVRRRQLPQDEPPQRSRPMNVFESASRVFGYDSPWLWLVPCRRRKDRLIDEEIVRLSKINV